MIVGIEQKISPIKFGFLIKPNSKSRFKRAVQVAFSMWGGVYSPILPLYKRLPKSIRAEYDTDLDASIFYKNSINNYDPDIILYDDDLDIEYVEDVSGDRIVMGLNYFIKNLLEGNSIYGIELTRIIDSYIKSEFKYQRNDDLRLVFPKILSSDLFLNTFLGTTFNNLQEQIISELRKHDFFKATYVSIDNVKDELLGNIKSIYDLNLYSIKLRQKNYWSMGSGLFFMNANRLFDLVNFWNIRALGWNIVPIPIEYLDTDYFKDLIVRYTNFCIKDEYQDYLTNFLVGAKVNKDIKIIEQEIVQICKKITDEFHYAYEPCIPRYWENKSEFEFQAGFHEIKCSDSHYYQIESSNNKVNIGIKKLPFPINYSEMSRAYYKINLSTSYFDGFAKYAGIISGIGTNDWLKLTSIYVRDRWRLSQSGLKYLVNNENDEISFQIPDVLTFFKCYFSKSGHIIKKSTNGLLANEVLNNFGGILGMNFLLGSNTLKIIELFENRKELKYAHLLAEIKKTLQVDNKQARKIIFKLLENNVIEMGALLQCKVCRQSSFYQPKELDLKMSCKICRNKFELPTDDPGEICWSYRGIGPFSGNNKAGGIISVFLCLRLFNLEFAEHYGELSSLIEFEIEKRGNYEFEVDLAVLLQDKYDKIRSPDLFLCECKTYKYFSEKDIERMRKLGDEFPNSILTFATLNDRLTDIEKTLLIELANYFRVGNKNRPRNPLLILTSKELLNSNNSIEEYRNLFHRNLFQQDWIEDLCDLTVQNHLGLKSWDIIRTNIDFEENY